MTKHSKTAAAEELPEAVAVMDPFHVVRLAGDAVERCRRRVQLDTLGHRGRKEDPLYKVRRTLLTGADLLTDKQYSRIQDVFDGDDHAEVEATWRSTSTSSPPTENRTGPRARR